MRVMAIDVGTNSTLDLTADIVEEQLTVVERGIVRNRLGADVGEDGALSGELLTFNRSILANLAEKARRLGCERIGAVGTHALRRAVNSGDFVQMAASCNVPLEIISDADEARLAWQGVFCVNDPSAPRLSSVTNAEYPLALLDVGGGSTELSAGGLSEPLWSASLPIGGVTLGRLFFRHDPPLSTEIQAAEERVREAFAAWQGYGGKFRRLVGIAGSIYALSCLSHSVTEFRPDAVEGQILTAALVNEWRERLSGMNLSQRKALSSMPPARAESIVGGALIVSSILDILEISELLVSERGLLFGLAMRLTSTDGSLIRD